MKKKRQPSQVEEYMRSFHRFEGRDFSHEYGLMRVEQEARIYLGMVTVRAHDEILPWLHIGRVPVHGADMRYIKEQGFGAVVDLCGDNPHEGELAKLNGIEYIYEHVIDGTCPKMEQFEKLVCWIHAQRKTGKKVYVHCHAGAGRAPTTVIAYLIASGVSLSAATETVLTKRRGTSVSRAQFVGLAHFDVFARANRPLGDTKDTEGMS